MSDSNFIKLDIDDSNGHEWVEIKMRPIALIGKTVCKKCGYFRRTNEAGVGVNKECKGLIKVELR